MQCIKVIQHLSFFGVFCSIHAAPKLLGQADEDFTSSDFDESDDEFYDDKHYDEEALISSNHLLDYHLKGHDHQLKDLFFEGPS